MYNGKFPRQSKDKVFVFKMFVYLVGSGINQVRCMQYGRDMENSYMMFDHVKRLCNWIITMCHVYNNNHCKVLTIAYCDI